MYGPSYNIVCVCVYMTTYMYIDMCSVEVVYHLERCVIHTVYNISTVCIYDLYYTYI